jgi:hypothetical protein
MKRTSSFAQSVHMINTSPTSYTKNTKRAEQKQPISINALKIKTQKVKKAKVIPVPN